MLVNNDHRKMVVGSWLTRAAKKWSSKVGNKKMVAKSYEVDVVGEI